MTTPEIPDPKLPSPQAGPPILPPDAQAAAAAQVPSVFVPPAPVASRSGMSDGDWHRMHPFTPLLRGGLFLIVILGIVVSSFRDRLIQIFLPGLAEYDYSYESDAIDYVIENDYALVALGAVGGTLIVLLVIFYLSWRFHSFRITDDDVEVRSGVLFRTQRRAPLDRVQGVNLTRPMLARLLGMAKLEVLGAGQDSNVKLEYLSTANAETVRADILRLASGRRLEVEAARSGRAPGTRVQAAAAAVSAGVTGLIEGAEQPVAEPASVVHIPVGRIIGSQLLSGATIWVIVIIVGVILGGIFGTPWVLFSIIPAVIGVATYWWRSIARSLRYSIAPTPDGVRITFGLLTTVTEILPPGRVHAVEVLQPLLWRMTGWWAIRVTRMSGKSATEGATEQYFAVLPVGTRADVERVLALLLPGLPADNWGNIFQHGLLGPGPSDPYTTTPRRGRWLRPLSWRRNGFLLGPTALYMRRGRIWRSLEIFPLERAQSLGLTQGPVDRALNVVGIRVHTIVGPVPNTLGIIDRADGLRLFEEAEARSVAAAASDRSHRWESVE